MYRMLPAAGHEPLMWYIPTIRNVNAGSIAPAIQLSKSRVSKISLPPMVAIIPSPKTSKGLGI